MCGIAGFSLSPDEKVNAKRLMCELLLGIEHRGQDATGFAFQDSTGTFQVHKAPVKATDFVSRRLCLPKNARTAIAHTRYATQGSPEWNDNNHPIATGNVVGVHNGHISNDDELFRDLHKIVGYDARIAVVDSEAPFAVLGHLDNDNTTKLDVLESVRGAAAFAWLDQRDESNVLHLARVDSSPLIVAETDKGSVLFASEKWVLTYAAEALGMKITMLRDIEEGSYLAVEHGEYVDVRTFQRPVRFYPKARKTPASVAWEYDEYLWDGDATPGKGATVYRMGDRTVVEEAEVLDDFDDARRAYMEWWEANTVALDNALDKEVSPPQEDPRFQRWLKAPRVNVSYIEDIELPIPKHRSESEYLADQRHLDREMAIEAWCEGLKNVDEDAKTRASLAMGAGLRPGDPVRCEYDGTYLWAHIVEVPDTFPGGNYILRGYVYNPNRPFDHEAILLSRTAGELQPAFEEPHFLTDTRNKKVSADA